MAAAPHPPRPKEWEIPSLRPKRDYWIAPPALANDISADFLDSLASHEVAGRGFHDEAADFLRNIVDFEQHPDWEPQQLLGKGGYGSVALWARHNSQHELLDELAVKLQKELDPEWYSEAGFPEFHGLLAEAVIHKQLNEYDCENILHLRGYAYVTDEKPPTDDVTGPGNRWNVGGNRRRITLKVGPKSQTAGPQPGSTSAAAQNNLPKDKIGERETRMYTEFAPYQTLDELRVRYRAWDELLPEEFLWHVFDSLTAAIQILDKGPKQKFSSRGLTRATLRKWPSDWGVVHFDLKPNNIFLGYEPLKNPNSELTGGSRIFRYPVIKVSDYGIACITGPSDPTNPRDLYCGTPGFKPSEQTHYGVEWANPPNGRNRPSHDANNTPFTKAQLSQQEERDRDPGWKFSSAANVWSVGKIMYDLATLSNYYTLEEDVVMVSDTEAVYTANGGHFLDENDWNTIPFQMSTEAPQPVPVPYTDDLMNLVRECLRPSIRRRIKVGDLRTRTRAGLAKAEYECDREIGTRRRPVPRKPSRPNSKMSRSQHFFVPPVYYDPFTINNMPPGTTAFPHNDGEYLSLISRAWAHPQWADIAPPDQIWNSQITRYGARRPRLQTDFQVVNGRIRFDLPPPPRRGRESLIVLSDTDSYSPPDGRTQGGNPGNAIIVPDSTAAPAGIPPAGDEEMADSGDVVIYDIDDIA